jgi:hypothetical protein
MTDQPTVETFTQCLNGTFTVRVDDSTSLALELIEVTPLPAHSPPRGSQPLKRAPFSLVFRGPKDPLLPQRIYRFEHESLGDLDIFIVPIGPDEEGLLYEAVFN